MSTGSGPNKSLLPFLVAGISLFMSSTVVGCYVGLINPELLQALAELLRGQPGLLPRQPVLELRFLEFLGLVLLNNSSKCLAAILLGPAFGLFPLILGVVNGFILGVLSVLVSKAYGPWFFLAAVAPHGVFEVPAMVLSVALGLRAGWALVKKLRGKEVSLRREVKRGLKFYLRVILPLIVFAAFIETFLTPIVMSGLIK